MRPHSIAPPSSIRRVKNACVSSSAIPSWWSTQPSRVTFKLKVNHAASLCHTLEKTDGYLLAVESGTSPLGWLSPDPRALQHGGLASRRNCMTKPPSMVSNLVVASIEELNQT